MLQLYLSVLEREEQKRSFEELYINYKQYMYSVCFNILKNVHDSEDAVHQAFLNIANSFEKISQLSCHELKPYVVIIAKNAAINIYNKNKRNASHHKEFNDDTTAIEIDFFENYNYEVLLNCILQLDDIYKDVLYLRYVIGFSTKEIAKMLTITENTVSVRIGRAKKQLKNLLEEGEQDQ